MKTLLIRSVTLVLGLAAAPLAHTAERAIDKSIEIAATLDEAWSAWTTREGIVSFFAPDAKIEPRVGGAFQIYIDPTAPPASKGADEMRFLALQPKKMISFDWNAPPSLPWGDGGEWDKAYAHFDRAWGNVLGNLKKRFDNGPQDWTAWLEQLRHRRAAGTK